MTKNRKTISLDIEPHLLDAIDARAKDVGLSRNEWFNRTTKWVIHNLPVGMPKHALEEAARCAPEKVRGIEPVDMGLDTPEGTR